MGETERMEKGVWDRGRRGEGNSETEIRKSGRRGRQRVRGERQGERRVNK